MFLKKLLFFLVLSSQVFFYGFSENPESYYYMSETELLELDSIIKTQAKELMTLSKELKAQKDEVKILWMDLQQTQNDLQTAKEDLQEQAKLLKASKKEVRKKIIKYSLLTGGLGIAAGAGAAYFITR